MKEASTYRLEKCAFEATLACNLNCRHCGSRAGKPRSDELTLEEASRVFGELSEIGCSKLVLMGGEVMLRPDWVQLIEAGVREGMMVGLLTNGILFDDEAARLAKEAGLHALGLSVDGIGDVHDMIRGRKGVFAKVLSAMVSAEAAGVPFSVVTQVNRENLGQLEEIHAFVRDCGSFAWQVQTGENMGNMKDNSDLLLTPRDILDFNTRIAQIIRSSDLHIVVGDSVGYFGKEESTLRSAQGISEFMGCQAGKSVIGVESNGNIKGCLSINPGYDQEHNEFVEGNVRTHNLSDLWNSPDAFAYNRNWNISQLGGICRTCEYASKCKGGCRSQMVSSGQGVENPLCVQRIQPEIVQKSTGMGKRAAAAVMAAAVGIAGSACSDETKNTNIKHDSGVDGGDVNTDTETDVDTEIDTDQDTGSEYDGGITLYMFCMDVENVRTGVPVASKCGGSTCAMSLIRAQQKIKQKKGPNWGNNSKNS